MLDIKPGKFVLKLSVNAGTESIEMYNLLSMCHRILFSLFLGGWEGF